MVGDGEASRLWRMSTGSTLPGVSAVAMASGQAGGLCLMPFVITLGKKKLLGQNLYYDVVTYKGLHCSLTDLGRQDRLVELP